MSAKGLQKERAPQQLNMDRGETWMPLSFTVELLAFDIFREQGNNFLYL